MVSTRHHPRQYPPPDTPSKGSDDASSNAGTTRSTRSTRAKSRPRTSTASPGPESPTTAVAKVTRPRGRPPGRSSQAHASTPGTWQHTPSHLILIWLALSLPLVIWDTLYIFGRPATFPGGWLHAPIWSPYSLYYKTDLMYGQLAWDESNGFTAAQGACNVTETLLYFVYLWIVYAYGEEQEERRVTRSGGRKGKVEGRGASSSIVGKWLGEARIVDGFVGGVASLIGFAASTMTWHKTVLYGLNEAFSGWRYVGHNSASDLFLLWILPNGMWIIFPAYMMYLFGAEILEGLAIANGAPIPEVLETKEE